MENLRRVAETLERDWSIKDQQEHDRLCEEAWKRKWLTVETGHEDSASYNDKSIDKPIAVYSKSEQDILTCNEHKISSIESQTLAEKLWYQRYLELQEFKEQYGHCNVPKTYTPNEHLGRWVSRQRLEFKKYSNGDPSELTSYHVETLKKIGFCWNSKNVNDALWYIRYEELVEFKKQFGHCNVPKTYSPNFSLGKWVSTQRRKYKKTLTDDNSKFCEERKQALEKIGFKWVTSNLNEALWQQRYHDLLEFKRQKGHCDVPHRYASNLSLGEWVSTQRREFKKKCNGWSSCLTEQRIQSLNKVGFQWIMKKENDVIWKQRYESLLQFKRQYGHCNVPQRYPENDTLGKWVATQRREYRKRYDGKTSHLSQSRLEALEKIDFQWQVRVDVPWKKRFEELIDFKKKYGHCNVPRNFLHNKALGEWVYSQRRANRTHACEGSYLSDTRKEALQNIGFKWNEPSSLNHDAGLIDGIHE